MARKRAKAKAKRIRAKTAAIGPMTPHQWRGTFIETLRETANVRASAQASRISRTMVYKLRKDDPDFREAWTDALEDALDLLEEVAFKRAKESSDTLLIFLLKSHRREVYGDRIARTNPSRGSSQSVSLSDMVILAKEARERREGVDRGDLDSPSAPGVFNSP